MSVTNFFYLSHFFFFVFFISLNRYLEKQKKWMDKLKVAGATVVKVTARSGSMSCNYIVFVGADDHKEFCVKHGPVPSLAEEWLIQCMINQRIVAIREHPTYTDFNKHPDA